MPSFKEIFALHPKLLNLEISICFLGVPSGLDSSHKIFPLKPVACAIFVDKFLIDISKPVPTLR